MNKKDEKLIEILYSFQDLISEVSERIVTLGERLGQDIGMYYVNNQLGDIGNMIGVLQRLHEDDDNYDYEVEYNVKRVIKTTGKVNSSGRVDNKIKTEEELGNGTIKLYYVYNERMHDYFKINGFMPIIDKKSDISGKCKFKDNGRIFYRYLQTQNFEQCRNAWSELK